ncbi:MAG: acyltransferase [Bacteroidales bacterium]|nr:acyltransferase [Bacteroidales bacterium]
MDAKYFEERIFSIDSDVTFTQIALQLYDFQRENNPIFRRYLQYLGRDGRANSLEDIICMPVGFYKDFDIKTTDFVEKLTFTSSGTTGKMTSRHFVKNPDIYYKSLLKGFQEFYGDISQYTVLALLPAYLERTGSSLVTMVEKLMEASGNGNEGFFLYDFYGLAQSIDAAIANNKKVLLIGVTFALLDFAERFKRNYGDRVIIMETGGMKGRRKEMVREEVHEILCNSLGVNSIHSEYGMTELLSQAYSWGGGIYRETSTMRILIREHNDPFHYVGNGTSGGINVIDLANIYSCSFLETSDIGIKYQDGSFKVLGRFDEADRRGCNLLYAN